MSLRSSQVSLALARVLIAGYVDAYALLNFGVYASFMTGNTTSGGVHAGQGNLAEAGHSLLPIPCFLAGILAGNLLLHADQNRALLRNSVLVVGLLAGAVSGAYFTWPGWLGIVLLSGAMGLLNTSVTGMLRAPLADPQDARDRHWRRAGLLGRVWTFFLVGAVLGAALALRLKLWTLLLPAVLLLLLALLEPPSIGEVAE